MHLQEQTGIGMHRDLSSCKDTSPAGAECWSATRPIILILLPQVVPLALTIIILHQVKPCSALTQG